MNSDFTNELMHFGIKRRSGRYAWGSGERPYQSGGGGFSLGNRRKKKQAAREAAEAERRAKAKAAHDAAKPDVLQRGSATQVKKYLGELSNKELQDVTTRLRLEGQIKELSSKEVKGTMEKIDKYMKDLKTIDDWAKIGISAYNSFASAYNATPEGKKNPLTKAS